MGIRLVRNAGNVIEPAVLDMYASGVVKSQSVVTFERTGGVGVAPASSTSTTTNIFGICNDYAQGASDVMVKVVPFVQGQLYEIDCVNAASTAQIGLRHALDNHQFLRNTATDLGAGNAHTAVFRAIAMVGSTSGSGKLIGYFRTQESPVPTTDTTFV